MLLIVPLPLLTSCTLEQQTRSTRIESEQTTDLTGTTSPSPEAENIKIDRDRLPPAVNEETGEIESILLVPHLIAPGESYRDHPLDAPISSIAGFPVARLNAANAENVRRIGLFVAESGTFDEEAVGFGILTSIRYAFADGRTLYISTTRLSPAALEQTISFSGDAIRLPTQGEAWLERGLGLPTTPYNLNFVKDNLIITVTGDVAVEELLFIANQLEFE